MGQVYQVYVTDALRLIGEHTAKYAGGSYLRARLADIINPPKEDTRTAGEIIEHMKKKLASL